MHSLRVFAKAAREGASTATKGKAFHSLFVQGKYEYLW